MKMEQKLQYKKVNYFCTNECVSSSFVDDHNALNLNTGVCISRNYNSFYTSFFFLMKVENLNQLIKRERLIDQKSLTS